MEFRKGFTRNKCPAIIIDFDKIGLSASMCQQRVLFSLLKAFPYSYMYLLAKWKHIMVFNFLKRIYYYEIRGHIFRRITVTVTITVNLTTEKVGVTCGLRILCVVYKNEIKSHEKCIKFDPTNTINNRLTTSINRHSLHSTVSSIIHYYSLIPWIGYITRLVSLIVIGRII